MELESERSVRNAEKAVADRKSMIAQQWSALRKRGVDGVTRPTTLGALVVAGAVVGWRSGAKTERTQPRPADGGRAREQDSTLSVLDGALRSFGMGVLRGVATVAVEELVRGSGAKAAETPPTGAGQADVDVSGEVSGAQRAQSGAPSL